MSAHGDMLQEYMQENAELKAEVARLKKAQEDQLYHFTRFLKGMCVILEKPGTRGKKGEGWMGRLRRALEVQLGMEEGMLGSSQSDFC